MTLIRVEITVPDESGVNAPAHGDVYFRPTKRRNLAGVVVLPAKFTLKLGEPFRDEDGVILTPGEPGIAWAEVEPSEEPTWAWEVTERTNRGRGKVLVSVPDVAEVEYENLVVLDPVTMDPDAEATAAWSLLLDQRVPPTGTTGHVLTKGADGTNVWQAGGGGGGGGAPTGPAGGVLSDAYPNPGFAVNMAEQSEVDAVVATLVPNTRTVNTKPLSSNVVLNQDDVADGTTNKAYTATDKTKLAGVATGATANDTDANLKNRANHTGTQSADTLTDGTTNKAFLATERTKLTGVATGATANDTDANLKARANHTGTQSADTITDGTTNKAYTAAEKTKLAGVATAATANSADATLLARANHTGSQTSSTISDLTEAVQDIVGAFLAAGTGITVNYDDTGNVATITAIGGGGSWDGEQTRDTIGSALLGSGLIAVTVNDAGDTITLSTTATANDTDANLKNRANHTGTQSADTLTDGTTNKAFLATERTKLTGIASSATANDTDANLKARANHTGTQTASTISDFSAAADARITNAGAVVGPASATDNAVVRFDTTSGKLVQSSATPVVISDAGSITIPASQTVDGRDVSVDGTKLDGIASGATANSSDATLLARANHTGTQSADTVTDGTTNKAYTAAEKTKLAGIATAATANDTDANLKARANHTGTQSADTLTDGTTNKAFTANERTKLAGVASFPSYVAATLLNKYDPRLNCYNVKGSNTRLLRRGLGRAATGQHAEFVVIGDSTTVGAVSATGPTWDRLRSWPIQMRDHFGVPIGGTGIVRANEAGVVDDRWGFTGTWNNNVHNTHTTVNGATATFTTNLPGNRVTVMYYDSNDSSTWKVTIDGVDQTTVTNNAGLGWKKVTYSVLVGVGSTVVITKLSGGFTFVSGVSVWDSNGGLQVHAIGQGGSTASGGTSTAWVYNTGGNAPGAVWALPKVTDSNPPDVVFCGLGVNDIKNAVSPSTVMTALTTLRTRYSTSDFVLVASQKLQDSSIPVVDWEAFLLAIYNLADTLDVPLVDHTARLGMYSVFATANGLNGDAEGHLKIEAQTDLGRNTAKIFGGVGDVDKPAHHVRSQAYLTANATLPNVPNNSVVFITP